MQFMRERIHGYEGGYPIWSFLWPVPTPRQLIWNNAPNQILIKFVCPAEKVLLSDFRLWEIALLWDGYIAVNKREEQWWNSYVEAILEDGAFPIWEDIPLEYQVKIKESWTKIFDLEFLYHHPDSIHIPSDYTPMIQGVLEEIRLEDVVSHKAFSRVIK